MFYKFLSLFRDTMTIFDIESDAKKYMVLRRLLRGKVLAWSIKFCEDTLAENDGELPPLDEVEAAIIEKYGAKDPPLVVWCRLTDIFQEGDIFDYN